MFQFINYFATRAPVCWVFVLCAWLWQQISHENIVKLYAFFEEKHFYYLVMEILDGGELFDRIVLKQFYNGKEAR